MFQFLSHPLDPAGYAWPGEPVVKVEQCTEISDTCPFASFMTHLPNHCGTHMDAPRHFVPNGLNINQLPIEYFCHKDVLLIDVPKEAEQPVMPEDLMPYADQIKGVTALLVRTGFEKYRDTDQDAYQNHGPYMAPELGKWLCANFPNLLVIGMDFLALGSPCNDLPPECHRNMLGYYTEKFVTAIEDMHLSDIPAGCLKQFFNAPLRVLGVDSSQVVCIAEV